MIKCQKIGDERVKGLTSGRLFNPCAAKAVHTVVNVTHCEDID